MELCIDDCLDHWQNIVYFNFDYDTLLDVRYMNIDMSFYYRKGFLYGRLMNCNLKIFIPNSFYDGPGITYIYSDPDYYKDDLIDLIDLYMKEIDLYCHEVDTTLKPDL